jgi:putative ABC transport system permease protein
MARRDARAGSGSLTLCGGAIAIGVAALVALGSFRASVEDAVAGQGRDMLGADAALSSRRAFPDSVRSLLDSLARAGAGVSRTTGFPSMVLAPANGSVRLLEVRAIEGGWPFYGRVETEPRGAWAALRGDTSADRSGPAPAVVDPEAAAQLAVSPGDTLRVGRSAFTVVGVATSMPDHPPTRVFDRPRVYIPAARLAATGLVERGSLVTYGAYLETGGPAAARAFLDAHRDLLRRAGVRSTTPAREQERLTRGVGYGTRFLGLVGLAALLLGGVGVASGARVLAATRLRSAAVLRCLGASRGSVLGIFLLETLVLSLVASAAGVAAGVAIQAWLPRLLSGFLAVPVGFRVHPDVVAAGLGVGVGSALAFALLPLLDVRDAPPLAALRRAESGLEEGTRRRDPWRWVAAGLLVAAVAGLCAWQAPSPLTGLAYAGGLAVLALVLAGVGRGLAAAARRLLPRRAPWALRQGVSNLFRPRNQTLAVVVALGLATFLIGTVTAVQSSVLDRLRLATGPDQPDLVLFDIQPDQKDSVLDLLRRGGHPALGVTPIAVLRIAALNGVDAARLRAESSESGAGPDSAAGDTSAAAAPAAGRSGARSSGEQAGSGRARSGPRGGRRRPERWALGREYRSTWRDSLTGTETLVAGRWWDSAWAGGPRPGQVSLSTDIAGDLAVGLGDTIAWEAGGRRVSTVVTSLRDVDWARPALNFFAVFQPGVLDAIPATWVVLTRVPDPAARASLQRDLVERFPSVSAVDLARIEAAVRQVVGTVAEAVRFMTLFSVLAGLLILVAALWASRRQRLREAVLLRTLGARAGTLRTMHLVEYACLGGLGGLAGTALAAAAGWAVVSRGFGLPYRVPAGSLALLALATGVVSVLVGVLAGGRAVRRPPLEVLRGLEE